MSWIVGYNEDIPCVCEEEVGDNPVAVPGKKGIVISFWCVRVVVSFVVTEACWYRRTSLCVVGCVKNIVIAEDSAGGE